MLVRSPLPDLDLPDIDFGQFVLGRARRLGDKPALVDAASGTTLTYAELIDQAEHLAGGLQARGLEAGDLVAVCGFNTFDYAVAAQAVWRAGGVVVTVNPLFTEGEMRQELGDAQPRFVLADTSVLERVTTAARDTSVQEVFALGSALAGSTPQVRQRRPEDTALVLYSSGTTGLPKGVELTHRNLVASVQQLYSGDLARESDVLVAIAPFFHVVGLHGVLNLGVYAGSTIVLLARYALDRFLSAIEQYRISSAFLTPPVLGDLVREPAVEHANLRSLRSVLCAAAPLGAEVEARAAERLGCVVRQGYGMTEASGPVSTMLIGTEVQRRGSVGQLVPNTTCQVVDLGTRRPLGPDERGELLVRGPQVMRGYLRQPEATAGSLSTDGWLRTGDVGYADAAGFLYVVDRVKEIIKYKAYQVAPAELEAILLGHPAVADAAVVPSPDPEAGEVPKAYVVRREGVPVTADELLRHVSERVAAYKRIRRFEFTDTIPRSASGKILRRVLVERERAAFATRT